MLAVTLAFASSVVLGGTDFLAGLKSRRLGVLKVLVVSQLCSLLLLLPVMLVTGTQIPSGTAFTLFALGSGAAQVVGVVAFWRGLSVGAMGVVAPITAAGGGGIPVAFGLLEGDSPGPIELVGVALAVIGVVLASYEPGERSEGARPLATGIGYALIAGIGFGTFYVCISKAVDHGDTFSAAAATRLFTAAAMAIVALAARQRVRVGREDLPSVAAVGFLEITGIMLFAGAAESGEIAIIGALAALYPLTTVTLARVLLKEKLHRLQRLGGLLAIAGVVAIGSATGP
jgi:drug/metabolite transporter (DMT)-like permease